ncbi:HGH1-like protein [Mya arenaria]|uniref:Protein HGH1 homolog n=1 Tax=Mya arenaria TaxID=6604 RepID=A0ABY7DAP5_MYAAR|nr:HGH1-like protein [Mya arenaria]
MDKELLEKELAPFLDPSTKEDVKTVAVENVKGLTGTVEGKTFLCESEKLLSGIVSLTNDKRTDIKEMVLKALINIAADENSSWTILNLKNYEKKVCDWLEEGLNPKCKYADLTCKLVSNLTRYEKCADYVGKLVLKEKSTIGIDKIVLALCNIMHNDNADLHYLGAILSNLSQSREVRKHIMDKEQCIIQRLLPFTEFRQSEIRRAGIVGTLKNCCFDTEYHDWLLGDQVDILPRTFQKIKSLCATRAGKKYIKDKNTYVIMREYFKWEREMDPVNEIAAMNVIDMMIGDEPTEEFGENLKDVDIPEDVLKRFHEDDRKEREFAEKERQEKLAEMKELKTKGNS